MKNCNHKVPTVCTSEFRKWQSSKSTKKWQKIWQVLYERHMHIFRLWRKHVQSSKKISIKLYEELCLRGTHCLYIAGEKWLFTMWKKVKKNNNNYIQTILVTPKDSLRFVHDTRKLPPKIVTNERKVCCIRIRIFHLWHINRHSFTRGNFWVTTNVSRIERNLCCLFHHENIPI